MREEEYWGKGRGGRGPKITVLGKALDVKNRNRRAGNLGVDGRWARGYPRRGRVGLCRHVWRGLLYVCQANVRYKGLRVGCKGVLASVAGINE